VLEAMAMRVPIVSTSTGIEGIDCIDGKHVFVAKGAQDFSGRLVELLDNPAVGMPLVAASRLLVEKKFGWDAIGERLDAFYRRIVHLGHLSKASLPA